MKNWKVEAFLSDDFLNSLSTHIITLPWLKLKLCNGDLDLCKKDLMLLSSLMFYLLMLRNLKSENRNINVVFVTYFMMESILRETVMSFSRINEYKIFRQLKRSHSHRWLSIIISVLRNIIFVKFKVILRWRDSLFNVHGKFNSLCLIEKEKEVTGQA